MSEERPGYGTPESKKPYQPQWVTKLDVARRQICEAIVFFFGRTDPVITHSILSAGHQILADLGARSGVEGKFRGKTKSQEFRKQMNYAANFFKHADKDPDGRINIEPLAELNSEFLMDAVWMYQQLTGDMPTSMKIYMSWFIETHEDLFENVKDMVPKLKENGVDSKNFREMSAFIVFSELTETQQHELLKLSAGKEPSDV